MSHNQLVELSWYEYNILTAVLNINNIFYKSPRIYFNWEKNGETSFSVKIDEGCVFSLIGTGWWWLVG